ncbi:putative RNA-directed DNA polymerase [Helianthus annuus]|nr:putative RNA-directed DNA polymerase [Helianthus annuus]
MPKIIGKLLACRTQKVIQKLIGVEQTTYIKDRNIFDGHILLNVLHTWVKKSSKKMLMFKVDFAKAFDSVNWNYIDTILSKMGFSGQWRGWIKGYFTSARTSLLVNGSPTEEFPMERGVRQGDPLSPFLFIIAMEGLSALVNLAVERGVFRGITLPNNGPIISYTMYADDVMFVGEWDPDNLKNLKRILRIFYLMSGLKINFHKSRLVGVGVSEMESLHFANIIGCKREFLPIMHLGLPLGANMKYVKNWDPVLQKFKNKLNNWKAKSLSFGGHLTLVKSVLTSLPLYFLSMFKAPSKVIKSLDSIRRKFLWGGSLSNNKISWVRWDKVLKPKSKGGLGVNCLKTLNMALLAKWKWRALNESNNQWSLVVKHVHNVNFSSLDDMFKSLRSDHWSHINSSVSSSRPTDLNLNSVFRVRVGVGSSIGFWSQPWIGLVPLQRLFPNLYEIESVKRCSIGQRLSISCGCITGFHCNWKSAREAAALSHEVFEIENLLVTYSFGDGSDKWLWSKDPSGEFTTSSCRKWLEGHTVRDPEVIVSWFPWSPLKVRCFIWRLSQYRIPVAMKLATRGVQLISLLCPICGVDLEGIDHLFIECLYAKSIWQMVSNWSGFSMRSDGSVKDMLINAENGNLPKKDKKVLIVIMYAALWCLW